MHLTHLILALIVTAPPGPPVERWMLLPSNPSLEIYGKEGKDGRFYYTEMRPIAPQPPLTTNYGVNLSEHAPSPGAPVIMGTDGETARTLLPDSPTLRESTTASKEADATFLGWASGVMKSGIGAVKACAHADCPNGQCDKDKKPKPPLNPFKKKPILPIAQLAFLEPIHLIGIGVSLVVLVVIGTSLVIVVILAGVAIKYALSKRPPS